MMDRKEEVCRLRSGERDKQQQQQHKLMTLTVIHEYRLGCPTAGN